MLLIQSCTPFLFPLIQHKCSIVQSVALFHLWKHSQQFSPLAPNNFYCFSLIGKIIDCLLEKRETS